MQINQKSFNKVLFVGTGGGNDVFSTILAALSLRAEGFTWESCDIAGVLSPFHKHTGKVPQFNPEVREKQFKVKQITADSKRFIVTAQTKKEIKFVDAVVAKMVTKSSTLRESGINIGQVLGLPLFGGTELLAQCFTYYATLYDFIILVDVGGDIFYSGAADHHVLSPMFDAMVLRAFVNSGAPGILFEAGPGTDGEIGPEALEDALTHAGATSFPLQESVMNQWEALYQKWVAPVRTGRTVPVTIQGFNATEPEISLEYYARAHQGEERAYAYFTQRINTELCKKFFLLDPSKIENPFAVDCHDPMDWFDKTQAKLQPTNCEANLEFFRKREKFYQFLTPSPLFRPDERMKLLENGFKRMLSGECHFSLMLKHDWEAVSRAWPQIEVEARKRNGLVILKPKK